MTDTPDSIPDPDDAADEGSALTDSMKAEAAEHERARAEALRLATEAAEAATAASNEAGLAAETAANYLRNREWLATSAERATQLYRAQAAAVAVLGPDATYQQVALAQLTALTHESARLAELDKAEIEALRAAAHTTEISYLEKHEIAVAAREKAKRLGAPPDLKWMASLVGPALGVYAMSKFMRKP